MRHIPAYCPDTILRARPGDILAACDFKEIVYLGENQFSIWYKVASKVIQKRGFTQARDFYNSLPMPEPKTKKACL